MRSCGGVDSASYPFGKYRRQNTPAHSAFKGALFASISQNRLVMELRQATWSFALRTLALGRPGMVCDTGGHFGRLSDRSNHSDRKDDST